MTENYFAAPVLAEIHEALIEFLKMHSAEAVIPVHYAGYPESAVPEKDRNELRHAFYVKFWNQVLDRFSREEIAKEKIQETLSQIWDTLLQSFANQPEEMPRLSGMGVVWKRRTYQTLKFTLFVISTGFALLFLWLFLRSYVLANSANTILAGFGISTLANVLIGILVSSLPEAVCSRVYPYFGIPAKKDVTSAFFVSLALSPITGPLSFVLSRGHVWARDQISQDLFSAHPILSSIFVYFPFYALSGITLISPILASCLWLNHCYERARDFAAKQLLGYWR